MVESNGPPTIVWFRDDLRLADNPALTAACRRRTPVIALYVHDEASPGIRPLGGAARWWLHHSLTSLAADLKARGHTLVIQKGRAATVLPTLAKAAGAGAVLWNRRYGPARAVDDAVTRALSRARIAVETFEANLLFAPDGVRTGNGGSFQVFSSFWRAALRTGEPRAPLPAPARIPAARPAFTGESIDSLDLIPVGHDWTADIRRTWQPGERTARARLKEFVARLDRYERERDVPAKDATSVLSPHLRFGEISPHQVWQAISDRGVGAATEKFLSELGWREFAWHVLAARPDLATRNLKPAFDAFAWGKSYADDVWAWRRGRTGYPIVDAGMRQLWQTGWMHNRVRMIAASFLVKHMLTDWRIGEEWFWDTLVDADPANNPMNWQWIAGSGADAQPFFRIFNPVLQGEKFDADGTYVRRYVPELAALPARFVHKPWQAPERTLAAAGVRLGETYPLPLVDHAFARTRALEAFAALKQAS